MNGQFSFSGRIRSFRYAFHGIWLMLQSQHNAWVHAAASIAVLAAGIALRIGAGEWCWLILAIVSVWTAEALNTALELLADAATPEYHPLVGQAKDVAAGSVLLAAMGAVGIGLIVLGPPLLELLYRP